MHTVVMNGFGETSNVGDLALLVATVHLIRTVTPGKPIHVIPWQAKSQGMELKFESLLNSFSDVHLSNPLLPAPSSAMPFPEAAPVKKMSALAWSAWVNVRADWGFRLRIGRKIRASMEELKRADWIILRGCNIVHRGNNIRTLASVRRVTFPMILAQRIRKKTVLLNLSVGPIEHPLARRMVKKMVRGAAYVSVREPASEEYLERLTNRLPALGADTAFALPLRLPDDLPRDPNWLGVNLLSKGEYLEAVQGSWRNYETILRNLAAELNSLMRQMPQLKILCIPHEPDRVEMLSDVVQLRKLITLLEHPERASLLEDAPDPQSVVSAYASCSIAIGMRFHGFVLAALAGTPMIGIDLNSQKVSGIAASLGVGDRMADLAQNGQLAMRVTDALAVVDRLRSAVSANTSRLRQRVFDTFTEFARSSGVC
jgi:polysaccharide pyruvyl transferase WcaK-like protein